MSWVADLFSAFSGAGVTGIITGGISTWGRIKEKKIDYAYELKKTKSDQIHQQSQWKYEVSMYEQQARHETSLMENQLLISKEQGANENLRTAINADSVTTVAALNMKGMPWYVGAMRTLFRPWVTTWLWMGLVFMFLILAFGNIPKHVLLTQIGGVILINTIVDTFAHGAMASTAFWFGSRPSGARPAQDKD